MRVPDQGDIIWVELNPTKGSEMQGDYRTVLVLTEKAVNKFGMTIIAPITQGGDFSRVKGMTAPLTGLETQGVVVLNQIRALDLKARSFKKVEKADEGLMEECRSILGPMLGL